LGAAHTAGDEMAMVDPDGVLISGDVVQWKQAASANADTGSVKNWIWMLDQLGGLSAKTILPDHSEPGPAVAMIASERRFLADLQDEALNLKHRGVSAADAAQQVTDKLKTEYPDWEMWGGVSGSVKKVYQESD
jgi:glyoxylase-like metal-dependent hydrolase (beta-lactamase superfamily II)